MYDVLTKKISKIMELQRPFNASENRYLAMWKDEYKMKDDIILEAVKRAKKKGGKAASFVYVNGIIKNWHENNVSNYSEILKLDEKFKKEIQKKIEEKAQNPQISIKVSEDSKFLYKVTDSSAGIDLFANISEDIYIPPHKTIEIPTGISIKYSEGMAVGFITMTDTAYKKDIDVINKNILIKSDYNGELTVSLSNRSDDDGKEDYKKEHTISSGEKIAQLLVTPYQSIPVKVVENTEN